MGKGSLTLFMIIGLALIILIMILMILTSSINDVRVDFPDNIDISVHEYVEELLFLAGEEAIRRVSQRGGMLYPEAFEVAEIEGHYIPVAYGLAFDGNETILELNESEIKKNLIIALYENFDKKTVIDEFSHMLGITAGEPKFDVLLAHKAVIIMMDFEINITQGSEKKFINEFSVDIPTDFGMLVNRSLSLIDEIQNHTAENYPEKFNMKSIDYSCDDIIICYNEPIIKVQSINVQVMKNPAFYFATNAEIDSDFLKRCSNISNMEEGCK